MHMLMLLLVGCSEYPAMYPDNHLGPADPYIPIYQYDQGMFRRDGTRPMRRVRNPTGAGPDDDEIPCNASEERWVRVPCESWGVDDSPTWSAAQDRWICLTCIVNVCGEPLETGDLPTGWQFPTCPDRRTPIDNGDERPRHVRR